ncbi:VOC family protein [Microbacterium chocolatum]|uniref:VOC family protein n=1 Tax=Microbacterium aurantiacum TaxID=162393 RepID=UPI00338D96FE
MTEERGPDIDRSIYAMPMFVNIVVSDLPAAERVYTAAGFVTLATIPGPDGAPVLVHLRRQKYQDILMTHGVAAKGSMSASFAAGDVDLDAVAERLRASAAEVTGPDDTAWFSTDLSFTDHDGNTMTLTAPRAADRAQAVEWASEAITGDFIVPEPPSTFSNAR